MKFGRTFSQSFRLFGKNAGVLSAGGLIAAIAYFLFSAIPAAISGQNAISVSARSDASNSTPADIVTAVLMLLVFYPLLAGLVNICLRFATSGHKPEFGDIFSGFTKYGKVVGFRVIEMLAFIIAALVAGLLVLGLLVVGGMFLGPFVILLVIPVVLAPFIYIEVSWAYVVPLLFDSDVGVLEALSESRHQIRRNGFWPTLIIGLAVLGTGALAMLFTLGLGAVVVLPWWTAALISMYMQATDRSYLLETYLQGRPELTPVVPGGQVPPWAQPPADEGAWQGPYAEPHPGQYGDVPMTPYGTPIPEKHREPVQPPGGYPGQPYATPPDEAGSNSDGSGSPQPVKVDPVPPWEQQPTAPEAPAPPEPPA